MVLPLPHKADLVVVLGAGASVESGVPSFQNFHERATQVVTDARLQVALRVWKIYYSQWNLEEVMTALRFHDEIDVGLPLKGSLATAARAAGLDWLHPEKDAIVHDMVPLREVETALLDLVPSTLTATGDLRRVRQYELLADRLVDMHRKGRETVVVSFNWDTLFEAVFIRRYGSECGLRMPWAGSFGDSKKVSSIRLYKPHGSLSFELCMNSKCKRFGLTHAVGTREEWYETKKFETAVCEDCKARRELLVFPPHFVKELPAKFRATPAPEAGKIYAREWYIKTWREVYLAVKAARRVLSIGYSWSFTDYPMRFQFSQALAARRNKNPLDALGVVVGPKQSTKEWNDEHGRLQDRVQTVWTHPPAGKLQFFPTGTTRFMEKQFHEFAAPE